MGGFVIPPLPRVLEKALQSSRAPSLHGRCSASTLLRAHPTPSRLRPTSRVLRLYGRHSSDADAPGRGGSLQLLRRVLVLVPSLPPRRSDAPHQPCRDAPCCLRGKPNPSAFGFSHCRGYSCVHSRYGPSTRAPSLRRRCRWASRRRSRVGSPSKLQAVALDLTGLFPAEHVCLTGRTDSTAH